MTNHRNRNKKPFYRPTPAEVKQLRQSANITQEEAAKMIKVELTSYQRYESEALNKDSRRGMDASRWDLMKIKVAEYVLTTLTAKGGKEEP